MNNNDIKKTPTKERERECIKALFKLQREKCDREIQDLTNVFRREMLEICHNCKIMEDVEIVVKFTYPGATSHKEQITEMKKTTLSEEDFKKWKEDQDTRSDVDNRVEEVVMMN